ncbi:MAG: hypothetical protein AAFR88_09790 [Pseudomonadota bacterium]
MTRQLFALLALLSGLAALQAPVGASALEQMACNIGAEVQSGEERCGLPQPIREQEACNAAQRVPDTPHPMQARVAQALRLPVLMGIERAYE